MKRRGRLALLVVAVAVLSACKARREPVVVFAAASTARALAALEELYEARYPKVDVRIEISGSQTACRKISELNRSADVVVSADVRVIDAILRPEHATHAISFATNEVVLAHLEHSEGTAEITAERWPEVLLQRGVKLGWVDPDQAPIGYRTQQVVALAQRWAAGRFGADLARRIEAKVAPAHRMPHEGELVQLLRARVIDYAFVYRSTAENQNLKVVELPATVNLGDVGQAAAYEKAAVEVQMGPGKKKKLFGRPIVYGLTIPKSARRPDLAADLVARLLDAPGRRILDKSGFRPLTPARFSGGGEPPSPLRDLVKKR